MRTLTIHNVAAFFRRCRNWWICRGISHRYRESGFGDFFKVCLDRSNFLRQRLRLPIVSGTGVVQIADVLTSLLFLLASVLMSLHDGIQVMENF
jgi:hypothetical protein